MKLVADESLHGAIITRLRADGHTVRAIRETDIGAVDPEVLRIAVSEQALLLTQDKDFGELVYRLGLTHCGIVLVRLIGLPPDDRAELVSTVIRDRADELPNAFSVITESEVRIRPRPNP